MNNILTKLCFTVLIWSSYLTCRLRGSSSNLEKPHIYLSFDKKEKDNAISCSQLYADLIKAIHLKKEKNEEAIIANIQELLQKKTQCHIEKPNNFFKYHHAESFSSFLAALPKTIKKNNSRGLAYKICNETLLAREFFSHEYGDDSKTFIDHCSPYLNQYIRNACVLESEKRWWLVASSSNVYRYAELYKKCKKLKEAHKDK